MHYSLRHGLKRLYAEAAHFSFVPRRARYFIIVSQERTGSTLLSTLLSFHPRILTDMDVFYTADTWPTTRRSGRALLSNRPVRGFKFKGVHAPLHGSVKDVQNFLRREETNGLRIIRLQRHNILRQAISSYMCGKRNGLHVWKNRDQSSGHQGSRVHVDVEDVMERIKYFDRLTRFQDRMLDGISHLHIGYESELLDSSEHQSTANRAFEYLGLSPCPIETSLRKLTPNDLSAVISNYEELSNHLRETIFSSHLSDAT